MAVKLMAKDWDQAVDCQEWIQAEEVMEVLAVVPLSPVVNLTVMV